MVNLQRSLVNRILRSYMISGVVLYFIIFFYWLDSFNYYNILNVWSLLSYAYLLWMCTDKNDDFFSNRRLWTIVILYSMIFVGLYQLMSYFYTGDTLFFNVIDATQYERYSFHMKDLSFADGVTYISHIWNYDDWGAPISMAYMLKLVPYKPFVNLCYILMNSIGALCLFEIGKIIMSRKYAFMASLVYAISSYSIFFMSSFNKEATFCFLVIVSIFFLYQYWKKKSFLYLFVGGFASLLCVFFRVPVAIFIWLSYISLLLFGDKSHTKKGLFFFLSIAISFLALSLFKYSSDQYANSGDVTESYNYISTSFFQKLTSSTGALIGPFPTLFQVSNIEFKNKALYGAGLLLKFMLFFPFWKGAIYCLKSRAVEVYPLFVFSIIEMLGLCLVFEGLELRLALPHFSFFILAAFWYMDKFDSDLTDKISFTSYYYWTYKGLTISIILVFVVTLAWNMLLRIPGVHHIIIFRTDT